MSVTTEPVPTTRRCVVCGQSASNPGLLRIVRHADGGIEISPTQSGRGAYVHRNPNCLQEAAAGPRPLARALRQAPPPAVLRQIDAQRSELTAAAGAADIP